MSLTHGQRTLIRACHAGRVRRTVSGYDLWDKSRATIAARVNKRITELAAAGLVELRGDGSWRPTPTGEQLADITTGRNPA